MTNEQIAEAMAVLDDAKTSLLEALVEENAQLKKVYVTSSAVALGDVLKQLLAGLEGGAQ